MENEKGIKGQLSDLFGGMEKFVNTETVIGDPIHIDNTIILPLVEVAFGVGAGAAVDQKEKDIGGGGLGAKISPVAILIIQDGYSKLVNIKNKDSISKVIDMVPDIMDRFVPSKNSNIRANKKTDTSKNNEVN